MKKNHLLILFILMLSLIGAAWAREHLPPPNPVNATDIKQTGSDLLTLLHSRQFDELDRRLNAMQNDYEKNTDHENFLADAFNWIGVADPELEKLFQEWLKKCPESYAANLALGTYYMAMAVHWRGCKYINETHAWRIRNMDLYLEKAVAQFEKSLLMTKKPTISYTKLIAAARLHGDDKASYHWLIEALKHDPYCIKPRIAYMRTLEPRWGGSYKAMREFAEYTRNGRHPKLEKTARLFEGWIHWYSGLQKYLEGNYVAALDAYQKAIAIDDDVEFRLDRSKVYQIVGQTDLAMIDLNRVLELNPQLTAALYMRGLTLLDKRQTAGALKDLHLAAEHGNIDAIRKLGELYTAGNLGVPLNVEEGMKWWKKAAYFWDEYASYALGAAYERGLGVPVDKAAAVSYYRIAAEQGYGPAINDLGLMLWYGRGTPADRDEAVRLWVIGAKKNIWQSKHNLQFFLNPLERFKLAFHYPRLFLEDKTIMWVGLLALFLLSVLSVILIVKIALRMARTRQKIRE
jgi:TPR repeat protein